MRDIASAADAEAFHRSVPHGSAYDYVLEDLIRAVYSAPAVVPAEGWVVDGGANRGMHAFEMAKAVERVICFEPHRFIFKQLAAEVLRRGIKNITLLEQALSDHVGTADFFIINKPGGFALDVYPGLENEEKVVVTALLTTLDATLMPPRLDFVKLDLEGHEFTALRGGVGLLRSHRPLVAFEFGREHTASRNGFSSEQFFGFWDELDYDLYDICGVPFRREFWSESWVPWVMLAVPRERDPEPIRRAIDTALDGARSREAAGESPAMFGPPGAAVEEASPAPQRRRRPWHLLLPR